MQDAIHQNPPFNSKLSGYLLLLLGSHHCMFDFSQRENKRSGGHGPAPPSWPPMMPFGPPVSLSTMFISTNVYKYRINSRSCIWGFKTTFR